MCLSFSIAWKSAKHCVLVGFLRDARWNVYGFFFLEIGIMKLGQFMCLGTLQRLKHRFGNGYSLQVKLSASAVKAFCQELNEALPGIEIQGKSV